MLDLPWLDTHPAPALQTATVAEWPTLLAPAAEGEAFRLVAAAPGFSVYRLRLDSRIWLIEFADLAAQARALNRMAHVLEGRITRGAPLPDQAAVSGWLRARGADPLRLRIGHDYRLAELQGFFRRAQTEGLELSRAELAVRDHLRNLGLLGSAGGHGDSSAGDGAVITLARASAVPSALRLTRAEYRAVLRHELSHAELDTNPAYRAYCVGFWHDQPERVRAALREQFVRWHYDPHDEMRLASELQAYLWEVELGGFLDVRLRRVGTSLEALRRAFVEGLDARRGAATRLLKLPGMREPLARGPAWGAQEQIVKRVELTIP